MDAKTSQIRDWFQWAEYVEGKLVVANQTIATQQQQIASLSAQLASASVASAEIRTQLAAIAQRVTIVVIGGTLAKLTVTWDDNSSNELGFKVERSTDGGLTWTTPGQVAANVTTWTDVNLAPGTYSYRVYAYNATTPNSGYSNIAAKAIP